MPHLTNVTVTRQAVPPAPAGPGGGHPGQPALTWQTHSQGTFINAGSVTVNSTAQNPPPVGFFNNPNSFYVINGNDAATNAPLTSNVLQIHHPTTDVNGGVFGFQ